MKVLNLLKLVTIHSNLLHVSCFIKVLWKWEIWNWRISWVWRRSITIIIIYIYLYYIYCKIYNIDSFIIYNSWKSFMKHVTWNKSPYTINIFLPISTNQIIGSSKSALGGWEGRARRTIGNPQADCRRVFNRDYNM